MTVTWEPLSAGSTATKGIFQLISISMIYESLFLIKQIHTDCTFLLPAPLRNWVHMIYCEKMHIPVLAIQHSKNRNKMEFQFLSQSNGKGVLID